MLDMLSKRVFSLLTIEQPSPFGSVLFVVTSGLISKLNLKSLFVALNIDFFINTDLLLAFVGIILIFATPE